MRKGIGLILLAMILSTCLMAQIKTGNIEGTVFTNDGKPVFEANILLKELKKHTQTSENGEFVFRNIPFGKYTLVYSFAGVGSREVAVTVPPDEDATTNYQLPLNAKELEEVIVTYKRTMNRGVATIGKANIAIMDLPQSVSIIGENVIANQQAQRLSDVIRNVNGVYLGSSRASTQETFFARGYNFSSTNTFKNGFRVNSGSFPEMSSLESVEILKGSAAILYGNVAPGGIINMVTKTPKFYFGGQVNVRAGSFSLLKPSMDLFGPINKTIAYRLNGTFETTKSFRDVVNSKRYYLNPSFLFKLSDKSELLLQFDYLNHHFTPDFGIGSIADGIVADVPRSRFMGAAWQYAKVAQSTTSAEWKHSFNENWKLNIGLSYQDYQRDYFSLERIQAKSNGDWARPIGKTNNHEKYVSGQVNILGKFTTGSVKHNLLAGVDAEQYSTRQLSSDLERKIYDTLNLLDPLKYKARTDIPTARWSTLTETPSKKTGVYLQDLISITHNIKFLAGIRWSYLQSDPVKTTYRLKNDSVGYSKLLINKAFSPRLGLVYQPVKYTSLFVSYSNSFTPNSGTDIYLKPLPPSIIDQYELGVKNDFLDGKLNVNLTLYRIINNNLVQMAPFAADGKPNANSALRELTGQTTADGLELDFRSEPIKGLELLAGYSYNYTRYTRPAEGAGSFVKGQRLVNTPSHTANATAFYTVGEGSMKGFKMGIGWYYTGERLAGWNYTIGNKRPLFPIEAFSTIDLSAGYGIKRWSLLAKLANLTNTYNYYIHENYSINPIPPRNFVMTVGYKF